MNELKAPGNAMAEAYEGVDQLSAFSDAGEIENYREALLSKTTHQAKFIADRFPDARSILECCTGNGRLLVAMADQFEVLKGFDIANSRIEFARRWIEDQGADNIEVWQDDIFAAREVGSCICDLGLCITGAFGYFDPLVDEGGYKAAEFLAKSISPGGQLFLELYQHPTEIAMCLGQDEHKARVWRELPETDRFRFYLSEYDLNVEKMILHHSKTFIGSGGEIDEGRTEALKIYSPEEIEALFAPWFEGFEIYADWDKTPWHKGSGKLLICARRRNDYLSAG